jgi:hypothetical protein
MAINGLMIFMSLTHRVWCGTYPKLVVKSQLRELVTPCQELVENCSCLEDMMEKNASMI